MPNFTDYYQPCEPGKGLLVNGQYYEQRHGDQTLQMMVSDGVLTEDDEQTLEKVSEQLKETEKDLEDAHALVELLSAQIRGLGAEPESLPEEVEWTAQ